MTHIGISDKNRKEICKVLQVLLSNEYLLYTKTLNFHWNVESPHFHDAHAFFKDQYEQLFVIVDDVAEKIRSRGLKSFGSAQDFIKHATIKEETKYNLNFFQMVQELLNDHETIIRELRKDQEAVMELNDQGTNNFLIGIMETHEKMAWMLRAHLVK